MMREIKFRGINHETGEFVYGYYTKLTEGIRRIDAIISEVNGEFFRFYIHDSSTLGQFTGLKDKYGKEIYEGDILSHRYYNHPVLCSWNDCGFITEDVSITDKSLEVIGNIHENPELLEAAE